MPQKSITSFFKECPITHYKSENEISDVQTSPTKKIGSLEKHTKKRRRVVLDNDESEDEGRISLSNANNELFSSPSNSEGDPENDSHMSNESRTNKGPKASPLKSYNKSNIKTSMIPNMVDTPNISDVKIEGSSSLVTDKSYDPSKVGYHPVHDCAWGKGESVPYLCLAKTFEYIEATPGRIKITDALGNFFRSVGVHSPYDLSTCIYLCLNTLGPAYEGGELGVGDTILLKALGMTTGVGMEHLKSSLKQQGDLGTLAETIRSRQKTMFTPKPLTVSVVFNKLKEIGAMTGNASQSKKVERICSLLVACRDSEAKYLIRSLSGKLRIGLAEQTVLSALGQAVAITPFHSNLAVQGCASQLMNTSKDLPTSEWKTRLETCIANVKRAYCVCPNYDKLVNGLLADGPDGLHHHCFIIPGVPVKPMLAHPTRGVSDVLKRFDESDFTCEYKYDGERAQIHVLSTQECHVYSRNQENNTSKYPDIVNSLMPRVLRATSISDKLTEQLEDMDMCVGDSKDRQVTSCIIDSEVVAWDRQSEKILPFQILSTRKRKDVDESTLKVQVCVYAFDLLYLNGVSLIEKPLRFRRDVLRDVFPKINGEFMLATSLDSSDTEEIALFLEESIKGNCEGLMVKTLDKNSTYEIAKRSHNWLKLKKDYLDNVGDTLDLVVIGAFHGTGKRTGWYGGFLLACYDEEGEEYQTICKIGTGMKEEDLSTFSNVFKDLVISGPKPYYQYDSGLVPDHWFEPVHVWEVKAADLSISPAHKAAAGLADPEKGISLRFPRFLRVREDKKPETATSAQQVYELYKSQEQIKNQETPINLNDEDMY